MTAAQSSLIFNGQDGKMLSCKRWFVSAMALNFNLLISLLFMASVFGFSQNSSAFETSAAPLLPVDELVNWLEAKSVKYHGYKLSYPADGIIHAKGSVPAGGKTVRVNILEINRKINPSIEIKPQIASNYLNSKAKIKNIAAKTGAIAAVNGGYFKPQTGVPLGALVIENEILTGPVYNRTGFGITDDGKYLMGSTDFEFYLKNKRYNLKIDNINQPRMLSTHILLYTEKWGEISPQPPKYGINIVIEDGRPAEFSNTPVKIPKNGYILSAPLKSVSEIKKEKNLALEIKYPKELENSVHIISGGPRLVKNGEIFINTNDEKLGAITGKNPRTLVGYTKDDELIIVTVDGREKESAGMSLYEAANFMQKLGAVQAMNLDGGSSSVMYLNGQITNNPPVEGGILISGAITIGINSAIAVK